MKNNKSQPKKWFPKATDQGDEDAQKAIQYIEQQTNRDSNDNNNLSEDESTIIDKVGQETTVTSQPYSASASESLSSQSNDSEKWYIVWVIFLTILTLWGGISGRWVICAIGGVGLFVSGWVKTLFYDK